MKLTTGERKAKRIFDRAIKYWRRILLIDPIWTIRTNIAEGEDMEQGDANVDIGTAEYYVANINIDRRLLSLEDRELEATASGVACHELLHIATADFQRAALVAAGDNQQMHEELRYRYEQLVSRFSMILLNLGFKFSEDRHESIEGKNPRTSAEMLCVPEVSAGNEDGGGS